MPILRMGGAIIGAGKHYPPPCKSEGEMGSKYIVYVLYADASYGKSVFYTFTE